MLISTKGRYALRVIIDIAAHDSDEFIPLGEVAERQGISKKYLEAIIKDLVQAGIVKGVRGKGGGRRLSGGCRAAGRLGGSGGPAQAVSLPNPGGRKSGRVRFQM